MRMGRKLTVALVALLLGVIQPEATAGLRAQGQPEGIQVHGHWTIDVRNPDGTLVSHHDFENGLVGATVLAQVLGHTLVAGVWDVVVGDTQSNGPCQVSLCVVAEPSAVFDSPQTNFFKALTVSGGVDGIVMNGTIAAQKDGEISTVSTFLTVCTPDVVATSCVNGHNNGRKAITQALAAAIPGAPFQVKKDQLIQVKVVLTFQ